MKNRRGRVPFEVDGASYELAFTTNALATYQEAAAEMPAAAIDAWIANPGDMIRLRRLFWASVSPRVSLEQAGDLIDALGFGPATKLTSQAIEAAFGGAISEGDAPGESVARST